MNPNVDKLRELTADLAFLARRHSDILTREPLIRQPLDQAVQAAGERWRQVGGDVAPKQHPLTGGPR